MPFTTVTELDILTFLCVGQRRKRVGQQAAQTAEAMQKWDRFTQVLLHF